MHLHKYKFIGVLSLTTLVKANTIPSIDSSETFMNRLDQRDNPPWPYGVIGDSWASGVSYNQDVLYDNNAGHCLRTKESHGPQLEADNRWTGAFSSGLRDAGCSGTRLVDVAKGDHQMGQLGTPNVVVMTSGGNNANFGSIVDLCLYHSKPYVNYGPPFKDDPGKTGDCARSLNHSSNIIEKELPSFIFNTIRDILIDDAVKNNPDFLLYVTGYAQFFSPDYPDWCNGEHWDIWGLSPTAYLSKELRTEFNRQVSRVNEIYRDTVRNNFAKQARYIDLDVRFSGHRFCEANATHTDQLNTDTHFEDIYLWNLNWYWEVAGQPPPPGAIDKDGHVTAEVAQQQFGSGGVTAWGVDIAEDPNNLPENGWKLRPMHPRYSGYTRIKDAILDQLKADGLPKSPTGTTANPPAPSCSHVGDGSHCQCSDGSTPDPDEDNRCCLYHQPNGNDQCFSG